MTNLKIKVDVVEPFAEGRSFGEAGSYLRIKGVARGELDPAAPENRVIVDLDTAPRNARGLVEYETDFFILRPADPARTNGVLVYDVTNRGSKRIFQLLDDAPGDSPAASNDPNTAREAGSPTPPLRPTRGRRGSLSAIAKAMRASRSRPIPGNSPMLNRSGCCRRAACSRRSRFMSCGTRRPAPRCSASALPRCATSSHSCATSAATATAHQTR